MTFTKEQLRERAREKVKSLEFAVTQTAFADSRAELEGELELARIALASLEAGPVAITDYMAYAFHNALSDSSLGADEVEEIKDGLRAAFANVTAPPAPVSVPDYPDVLPCPVVLEPGLRFGKGLSTRTMLGALQRRAEYHAELEAMTPEQRAEHDAGMKEFAAMLQGAAGNSPVIPDGWVMVPVEPTAEMYDAGDRQLATKQVWDAMIAAAPKQEV